jgi:hypothetical protein
MIGEHLPRGLRGATLVELLLALPVVLLMGLGVAQFTLVYQAKHALDYALMQAARQGAVEHASRDSIVAGFAAGLVPYLYGAADFEQLIAAEGRAVEHVEAGAAAGWIRLRQRSPSLESFEDWAEPALDPMGEPIPGVIEIANDNLDSRRTRMQPASGTAGTVLSEPIGRRSGQTLADANLLRVELVYGLRLAVPVVGPLVIRTLSQWHGCSEASRRRSSTSAAQGTPSALFGERLGLLLLGPPAPLDRAETWVCAFLESGAAEAAGADGAAKLGVNGRIPLRASATVRMMSTARASEMTQARSDAASGVATASAASAPTAPSANSGDEPPAAPATWSGSGGTGVAGGSGGAGGPGGPGGPGGSSGSTGAGLSIGGGRGSGSQTAHPALCPAA